MAVLDLQFILRSPLSPKALGLGSLAYRAITLLPILPVKRVTFLAMRFLRVDVRNGIAVLHRILRNSHPLKVLWVDAFPVPADMVDDQIVTYRAMHREPSDAMCSAVEASQKECSVSITIKSTCPFDTAGATNGRFQAKPFKFFLSQKVHSMALMAYMVKGVSHGMD